MELPTPYEFKSTKGNHNVCCSSTNYDSIYFYMV